MHMCSLLSSDMHPATTKQKRRRKPTIKLSQITVLNQRLHSSDIGHSCSRTFSSWWLEEKSWNLRAGVSITKQEVTRVLADKYRFQEADWNRGQPGKTTKKTVRWDLIWSGPMIIDHFAPADKCVKIGSVRRHDGSDDPGSVEQIIILSLRYKPSRRSYGTHTQSRKHGRFEPLKWEKFTHKFWSNGPTTNLRCLTYHSSQNSPISTIQYDIVLVKVCIYWNGTYTTKTDPNSDFAINA